MNILDIINPCKKKDETIQNLKKEIEVLEGKIVEKQQQINKTNAYYKKILHGLKKKK